MVLTTRLVSIAAAAAALAGETPAPTLSKTLAYLTPTAAADAPDAAPPTLSKIREALTSTETEGAAPFCPKAFLVDHGTVMGATLLALVLAMFGLKKKRPEAVDHVVTPVELRKAPPPPPTPAEVKASRKELLAQVRKVLEAAGCDVDKARKAGKNMVFAAAEVGNVAALDMLVAAGADVNAPATTGETPTHVARAKGHAAAAAFLLGRGGVATAPARKKSKFGFPSPKKSPSKQ